MRARSLLAVAAFGPLAGCAALGHGVFAAAGPVAAGQRDYLLIVLGIMVLVLLPVFILVPLVAWYYRIGNKGHGYKPDWGFSWSLEGLVWIPPTLIVIGLSVLLWDRTHAMDPYKPLPSAVPPLEVQAIGFDWKWLFVYPEEGVATVNQLALPVGRPVHLRLTSGTVMQSFLIPRLAGQIYAMPGMTTELNLAADRAGTFRGENTQYSGRGFPLGKFAVTALPADDFAAWVARARAGGGTLDRRVVDALFRPSVARHPLTFGQVPPGVFDQVLARFDTGAQGMMK